MSTALAPSPLVEPAFHPEPDPAVIAAAEEMLEQQEGAARPPARSRLRTSTSSHPPSRPLIEAAQRKAVDAIPEKMFAVDLSKYTSPLPPPAFPGTPLSPYRHCPCVGSLPGRVCPFCSGTKWTRLCPWCEGEGRITLNVRRGAERTQPCGFCATRGTLPASLADVAEATRAAEEFAAGPGGQAAAAADDAGPEFRRAVRLPGIGVTATKRTGTLAARQNERDRLARRTKKRKKEKAAAGKAAAAA
jgi:pyruvate/2-oxoglutarate dehydrogenase complex dihydrolipoamide acyltransferase (E2) component